MNPIMQEQFVLQLPEAGSESKQSDISLQGCKPVLGIRHSSIKALNLYPDLHAHLLFKHSALVSFESTQSLKEMQDKFSIFSATHFTFVLFQCAPDLQLHFPFEHSANAGF